MRKETYDKHKGKIDFVLKHGPPALCGAVLRKVYDKHFFDDANELKVQSSAKVADVLCSLADFKTVFDIGCGMGLYLSELQKRGKEAVGCDSSADGVRMASDSILVFLADATKPILVNRKFDLVLCFEVAEHIQQRHSRQLVHNCVSHADRVFFTAAPKGQGGVGHINEQDPSFWIDLYADHGFEHEAAFSEEARKKMKDEDVVWWIANNFMSFKRRA